MSFALQPLSSPVGREVVGLDISTEIAPETAKALHAAWLEHGFLLFRGIGTSPEVQLRLSRCFGELEPHSIPVFRHPDYARQQDVGAGPLLATIRLVMLVALPAYAGMAAVAHPLVAVLLGDKWGGVAPLLPILAIAMSMMTLQILFAPATNARGVPGVALKNAIMGSVIMPAAFLIGSLWGLDGFAWGWVGGMAVLTSATVILSGRVVGLRMSALCRAIAPPLVASLVMAALVALTLMHLPADLPPLATLAIVATLGVALYAGLLNLIAPSRLKEALEFARNRGAADTPPTTVIAAKTVNE